VRNIEIGKVDSNNNLLKVLFCFVQNLNPMQICQYRNKAVGVSDLHVLSTLFGFYCNNFVLPHGVIKD